MKHFWKKIGSERVFSVINVAENVICGGRFNLRGKKWYLSAYARAEIAEGIQPQEALRETVRKIGAADYCVLTGSAADSVFFRFDSTDLPESAQRGAVEFELPRKVIRLPEKYAFQFVTDQTAGENGSIGVNVALYPQETLDDIGALLTGSGCTADEFVHPFMAVSDKLPQLYLPEVEKDFYFDRDRWMPVPSDPEEREKLILASVSAAEAQFVFSEIKDFSVRENLSWLMTACVIAANGVAAVSSTLRVLSDKVRPVRFRQHVILTVLLALLLVVNLVWRYQRTNGKVISEYRKVVESTKQLKAKTSKMKSAVKRGAKENKEMARVVEMNSGNRVVVEEFALLSDVLPKDVLVSSMRWSDNAIDLVLVCENDKIDIPALIQPLRRWRVAQLQQRQAGDSVVATINVKLVPLKDEKESKK